MIRSVMSSACEAAGSCVGDCAACGNTCANRATSATSSMNRERHEYDDTIVQSRCRSGTAQYGEATNGCVLAHRLLPSNRLLLVRARLQADRILVRSGLRRLLEDDPAIEVVGEASDGDAAVRLAQSLKPHVILMDYALSGMNGLTATHRILELLPGVAILMLSMYGEEVLIRRAFAAGARGYVLKDAVAFDLAEAVKQVARGGTVLDAKIAPTLSSPSGRRGGRTRGLSMRQLEVLQHICEGMTNQEIAATLECSVNTVAAHRAGIMKTLGIRRVTVLIAYAIRHGLVVVT
jgi:DNA-binding NarL/FixJ family response regulator